MKTANGFRRRTTIATLLSASVVFQFGGCEFGELTTTSTTTIDGRELLISLVRTAIIGPLDQLLNDAINEAFSDDG